MKNSSNKKADARKSRHNRIRSRLSGTAERPRLAVFRSNKNLYVQLIDDVAGVTLAESSTIKSDITTSAEKVNLVGGEIAAKAKKLGVDKIVFDRGGFLYAGMIKNLADKVREEGIQF